MAQNTIVVRARGARGPMGSQGQSGLQGIQGLQGAIGQTGPAGSGVTILGSYNSYAELIAAHPTGSVGNAYLVLQNLYVWDNVHNVWQNVGAIAGIQGVQGLTGDGIQGATGAQGLTGLQGIQGSAGSLGFQGIQGSTGIGVQGTIGSQGTTGSQGLIGTQGVQGIGGLQGLTGLQGAQGVAGVSFSTSQVSFKYEQASQSSIWNINHGLGFNPNVTILDYSGNTIESDIEYVNINNIRLIFSSNISGYAYLS
jgi:hypothetical protein